MPHHLKKDAPSGTAARLVEIILEERKLTAEAIRHGRQGIPGERSSSEVGVHSLRGGDVVGDHTVMFASLGERIELMDGSGLEANTQVVTSGVGFLADGDSVRIVPAPAATH